MNIRENGAARILVADDEEAIRESYAYVLGGSPLGTSNEQSILEAELFGGGERESSDFEVELCTCGDDAIEAVRKALEAGAPLRDSVPRRTHAARH